MALFRNRPQLSDPVNYVSVGQNKTLLVVGLGNIGAEYDGTRHNIGFSVVDKFVEKNSESLGDWMVKRDLKCQLASGRLGECRVIVIKPTTLMNLSGTSVQAVASFYKIPLAQILVVHDELDIEFGKIRLASGGASAGHNGIRSIIEQLGSDNFARIRIGIGPKTPAQIDSADFVLAKFSAKEADQLPNLLKESTAILSEYVYGAGTLAPDTRSFIV